MWWMFFHSFTQMQALQAKHQISLVGMLGPAFLSIPFFMSCFFGLQELHFVCVIRFQTTH